jgi:hypothetical protein
MSTTGALSAPQVGRAPLASESLASHYFTATLAPLLESLGGLLALAQPADPAALARAACEGAAAFRGAARAPAAPLDAPSAAAFMAAAGQPLLEALGAALLAARPDDARAAAAALLAPGGALAAAAAAGAAALAADAAYCAARGPLDAAAITPLASAAALLAARDAAARAAADAHGGAGVEGQPQVSAAELEAILAPFRK